MTRKRLLLVAALALLGIALGRCAFLCYPRPPVRFTMESLTGIHDCKTEADIVALLGMPAGDYGDRYVAEALAEYKDPVFSHPKGWRRPDGTIAKAWISDQISIVVAFNDESKVRYLYIAWSIPERPPTLAQRARDRLRPWWP
jgi:hypothetical protein